MTIEDTRRDYALMIMTSIILLVGVFLFLYITSFDHADVGELQGATILDKQVVSVLNDPNACIAETTYGVYVVKLGLYHELHVGHTYDLELSYDRITKTKYISKITRWY